MNRPEYEFFNFFKKLNYFFSPNKINFVLESLISDPEFVVKRNTIIKNQNNLNIFLKKGNNLIISNLSNSKIIAEEETNIFIYNSFSGEIESNSYVSLGLGSKIKGDIYCYSLTVDRPLFNKRKEVQFDGELKMEKSS